MGGTAAFRAEGKRCPWIFNSMLRGGAMFRRLSQFIGVLVCSLGPLASPPAWSAQPLTLEPRAVEAIKQMTDYLKGLQQFSVQADITEDFLLDSGLKVQYGRTVTASVRRPDRLRVESHGDLEDRQLFLDGDTATLVHLGQSQYSTLSVPTGIDAALDHLVQTYGLRAPLADLIYADAYDRLLDGTLAGFYLGLGEVHGHLCRHLAFRQAGIDWQIWVENGPTPFPRKLLITDKAEPEGLQFTALLSHWDTSVQLDEDSFRYGPSQKAQRIDLPLATNPDALETK